MTIWEEMKDNWVIKKSEIKDLGIDPNKKWGEITLDELDAIATELDVSIKDLI